MTGIYQHTLDAKGRLFIPAKLREELGDTFYVTVSPEKCLSAYSQENWKATSEKAAAMTNLQQRKVRPLFAYAARCDLDGQGRILLPQHLRALIEDSGETPAVNQIEVHPRFNQPGNRAFCAANGVAVEAYSPLGHGKDIESEPVVAAAKAHDVTPAQVVLRWHTQEGRIIIPKSKHVERMRVNLASSDFDLTSAELAAIDALDDPHGNVSADPATFMHSQSWADQHVRGNI